MKDSASKPLKPDLPPLTKITAKRDQVLRDAVAKLTPERFARIRDAYYAAVCGLRTLSNELELADDALLGEHLTACEAIDVMKKSQLGRVL